MVDIQIADSDSAIASTFDVLSQLRPNLVQADYVSTIRGLMETEGFRLAALRDSGSVHGVAGFRVITMLYRGRILVIDDLVTDATARSRGYGAKLIEWLRQEARNRGCVEIQLISRVTRKDAHRFYERNGFRVECLHFVSDA